MPALTSATDRDYELSESKRVCTNMEQHWQPMAAHGLTLQKMKKYKQVIAHADGLNVAGGPLATKPLLDQVRLETRDMRRKATRRSKQEMARAAGRVDA